VTDIRLSQQWL